MKIKELHLLSDNIFQTEVFYNTILDIKTEVKRLNEISFLLGETLIVFSQTKTNIHPVYHFAFDIPHNKLDEAFEWTSKRTQIIPVLDENNYISTFHLWNAKSFYFYDNNQNLLEFICRFDVDNKTSKSFNSSSILYASEIGIVSESAFKMAGFITAKYGIEEFSKQSGTDDFTALGDDYGLFVLVNNKRNWFPTNDLAKSFQTKIIFDKTKNENYELLIE